MRPPRRKSHRLMNTIKMDFREIGRGGGGVGWFDMTHDRKKWWQSVVSKGMNHQVT
jgi:hypothetical protein